jgi:stress response protein YsnF
VLEEVLVVQKQLLLKEEVHIITKRTETRQSGQETLRREEVLVEPIQGEAS